MRLFRILIPALTLALAPLFGGVAEDNAKLPDYAAFQSLLKSKTPVTWVLTGDSITHGALHTAGRRDYAEIFNERVRWEMGRKNDVWINTGVSGEVTGGLLANFDFRVARFKPGFVAINLGMNDCMRLTPETFRTNLLDLVKRVRELGAVPVLQVPNTVSEPGHIKKLAAYSAIIREVAAAQKVLLVDYKADWEAKAGGADKAPKEWLGDSIHPNGLGHAEMARSLFRALGIFDPNSAVCKPEPAPAKK